MEALWLRKESNTRAVILFHAYTGTPADVRMLAQFLHRHDYAVYVPVFSGHGTPDGKIFWQVLLRLGMKMPNVLSTLFEEKDFTRWLHSDYRWEVLWRQN